MNEDSSKIDKLLELELRVANKHLPIQRLTIEELINMSYPYVRLRDGSIHTFKKSELKKLRSYLNAEEAKKLLLPIIVILRPDLGEGTAVIEDPIAASIVAKILGIRYSGGDKLTLYKPHIAFLRRSYDTLFQFALSIDFSSERESQISP
ncbi:MAG: DUF61 family protein [Ignisphaera sp.]